MKDIAEVVWVGFVEIKLYNDYKFEKFLMLYMSLKFQKQNLWCQYQGFSPY